MDVRPHTSLKHRIIGYYLHICRDVMKGKNRSMYYVDLYAGDGKCSCQYAPKKDWETPIFSHLSKCKKQSLDLKCIFNDKKNMDSLIKNLSLYKDNILNTYSKDANDIYPDILNQIPSDQWSIFNLDPYNHAHLQFSTIESISRHEGFDKISGCNRKPEMIITLMTYTMQQRLKILGRENVSDEKKEDAIRSIDNSLGTTAWQKDVLGKTERYFEEDKTHNIFLRHFLNSLSKLGYDSIYFHIKQILNNGPVYFLIFATSLPKVHTIYSKRYEPFVKKLQNEDWIKENFSFYKQEKAREQGICLLDDFIK